MERILDALNAVLSFLIGLGPVKGGIAVAAMIVFAVLARRVMNP